MERWRELNRRFEIEQGLIDGSISIDDVPEVWCAKMRDVFGVNLPQDKDGCLRDSHWYCSVLPGIITLLYSSSEDADVT